MLGATAATAAAAAAAAAAVRTVGLYNTLAEAIHARDVAILAVHGYDTEIATTLAPAESYTDAEVVACRMQVRLMGVVGLTGGGGGLPD